MPTADSDSLVAFLATRDLPCPGCDYSLRGLTSDRCPECHRALVLTISLAEPPIVQFVVAVVGLAACGIAFAAGLALVFVVSIVEYDFPEGRDAIVLLWGPAAGLVADAGAVVWLLLPARRRWFGKQRPLRRGTVALGCWALSVAALAAWFTMFFEMM